MKKLYGSRFATLKVMLIILFAVKEELTAEELIDNKFLLNDATSFALVLEKSKP